MRADVDRQVITEELDEHECWARLQRGEFGRIAVLRRGEPAIFPVGYRVAPGGILIRTRAGGKLLAVLLDGRVAFEVDGWDADHAWSVVVSGWAEEVEEGPEGVSSVPLSPFAGPDAHALVRIAPAVISGRDLRLV